MTWAWYAAVCLIGSAFLRKVTVLRVVGGVLASATSFFLLSNFAVWANSASFGAAAMYPHTLSGLGACYAAALPFYGNDLLSTGLFATAFFGLPVLAKRLVDEHAINAGSGLTQHETLSHRERPRSMRGVCFVYCSGS